MYKYVYVQICVQNNMIIKTKYDYMCKIIFVPVHTCTYWIVMKYRCTYDLARLAGVSFCSTMGYRRTHKIGEAALRQSQNMDLLLFIPSVRIDKRNIYQA